MIQATGYSQGNELKSDALLMKDTWGARAQLRSRIAGKELCSGGFSALSLQYEFPDGKYSTVHNSPEHQGPAVNARALPPHDPYELTE